MVIVKESEYKGNPLIVLSRSAEDRYPFQFGLAKAKLIIEAIEEIKAWVARQEAAGNDGARRAEAEGFLLDLCEALRIKMTPERRKLLAQLDLPALTALREHLKTYSKWPSPAGLDESWPAAAR